MVSKLIILTLVSSLAGFIIGRSSVYEESTVESQCDQSLVTAVSDRKKIDILHLKESISKNKVSKEDVPRLLEELSRYELDEKPSSASLIHKYEKILELAPENTEALSRMAGYLNDVSRRKESVELYKKCLEIDPAHKSCNFYISLYSYYDAPVSEGYEYFMQCLKVSPNHGACNYYLAKLNHREGKYNDAVEYYLNQLSEYRSINRHIKTNVIHYELAKVYFDMGNIEEYKKHLSYSCDIGHVVACNEQKNEKVTQ